MSPRRFGRSLLEFMLVLVVAFASKDALAIYNDCTATLPLNINFANVSVPSSLPVGQPIPGARATFSASINCTTGVSAGARWYMTVTPTAAVTLVAGFSDVYTTPGMTAGVGFRIRIGGTAAAPISYNGTFSTFDIGPANNGISSIAGSFELVRTASTVAGGTANFSTMIHVPGYEYANGGNAAASAIKFGYVMQPMTVAGCSVTQSDIAVVMPSVTSRSLQSVGATAGNASFSIDLNCENGAKPLISLADATTPSNQTTDLTLAPGSTAQGIGVQVLYGATAVQFAPEPYTLLPNGTLTSHFIGVGVSSGITHLPFSVRYVRNGASMTPGIVKSLATFTLQYQ